MLPLLLEWGKGFGILGNLLGEDSPVVLANGFYGIAFYLLVIALGEIQTVTAANIQKYAVLLTNLLSVYLGYILLFVLKDKCVVCFSIYAINLLIAVMCFLRVHYVVALKNKKKGNKSSANQTAKTTGKKQQNVNKNNNNQNANKNNKENVNKGNQQQNVDTQVSKKKKEKGQKQIVEPVVNHQNAVSSKKKPEQLKNAQNNIKNRQNQNQSKKNQNAVQQNTSNKQSSNKQNANPNKHSKKKNN
ncbi:Vitamin K epoxide reductase complex subunit 1-like protein 1 [Armadillidium nasatum]|uniref:vitamin-K-epoxide reductase (warfarin-sensitive) n=1 Tax=Armadillidium nasatum TaxID=96803 RepID=A0A5N5TKX0_9CRUS|nr:Vitamin K epoxide reductase complex subunit 1-like protein 1 [Armadillidium nasatum]